jgi:hypothetical protein
MSRSSGVILILQHGHRGGGFVSGLIVLCSQLSHTNSIGRGLYVEVHCGGQSFALR